MRGLVVERPGVVSLKQDIPEPLLSDYSVLAQTVACGICNSTDLKIIEGTLRGFDNYPAVLGHESVGRVVECGKKVTSFETGDLVLRSFLEEPILPYHSGWGSFSELTKVYDYQQMIADGVADPPPISIAQQKLPDGMDPIKSAMVITFKEVLTGFRTFGLQKGQRIMINGCGPVGLSMVRLAKIVGAGMIIATDHHADRLELARRLGADAAFNPESQDLLSTARDLTGEGLDIFIDAVGASGLITIGLQLIAVGGKVGVYGMPSEPSAEIDLTRAPINWTLQSAQMPSPKIEAAMHEQVIGRVRQGLLDLDLFVTHVLPVEEFQKGIDLVKSREALKVILTF